MKLRFGDFVRTKKDCGDSRAGCDAMVVDNFDDENGQEVALTFGCDRYNTIQRVQCVGPELWNKSELDLETVY